MAKRSSADKQTATKKRQHKDFTEIRPHHFLIRNRGIPALVKGEGTFQGMLFVLNAARREIVLARLRNKGFRVSTLDDAIEALPALPPAEVLGEAQFSPLQNADERFSHFDLRQFIWTPDAVLEQQGQPGVMLCPGWIVRRKRHRGKATYYRAVAEGNAQLRLVALPAEQALLAGYAQARLMHPPAVRMKPHAEGFLLPAIELPTPHQDILRHMAEKTAEGWLVAEDALSFAQKVYAALGVGLYQ
jgi:hypothetical protein